MATENFKRTLAIARFAKERVATPWFTLDGKPVVKTTEELAQAAYDAVMTGAFLYDVGQINREPYVDPEEKA